MKGCTAVKTSSSPKWIRTAGATKRIPDVWAGAQQLTDCLDARVGPSTLFPDDRLF